MKIRVYSWEEAVKAAKERNEYFYDEGETNGVTVFGLPDNWEYWGKTITVEKSFRDSKGYFIGDWAVPNWLYEAVDDEVKAVEESREITQGWLCPRCGRIVSPFVSYCDCEG